MSKLEIYEGADFFPAYVALEVTLACNLNCQHCGSSAGKLTREAELTLPEWKKVVDELIDLGTEYFTLSGGEPFVWSQWRELCAYITSKKKILSIVSNGYHITDSAIKFLQDIGMHNIGVSVDGLKTIHEKIRRGINSFDHVVDAINRFKKTNIKVVVATSVNKLNILDLEALSDYLDKLGVDLWQVQTVASFGRAADNHENIIITPEQYGWLVNFIYNTQKKFKDEKRHMKIAPADSIGYCHGIAKDIWGDCEWSGCNAGRYVVGIKSNGDVVGCLSLQKPEFIEGNIRQQSLASIWKNTNAFPYNRKFTPANLTGSCKDCACGEDCRGGCVAMGTSTTQQFHNNPYCYKHVMDQYEK